MSDFVLTALRQVAAGTPLSADQAEQFMNHLMHGEVSPVQTAGLLACMALRGETVDEIVGFARGMRQNSLRVQGAPVDIVDTCGTGGDTLNTFNISTAAAIVAAAAGARVAKHGNRAASSKSGSADVLQAFGARLDIGVEGAKACLAETNLCFMFAQQYHPAMKHAAETRKQLGFRTIFNILGPLTNPAGARRQLLGVSRPDLVLLMAEALRTLGSEHVMVVHGTGGMDEISLMGPTHVAELKDGVICEYDLHPADFGLDTAELAAVVGGNAAENADMIRSVFAGETGPRHDIVALNAGAVLYVSGTCSSLSDGVATAMDTIARREAERALARFVESTKRLSTLEGVQ